MIASIRGQVDTVETVCVCVCVCGWMCVGGWVGEWVDDISRHKATRHLSRGQIIYIANEIILSHNSRQNNNIGHVYSVC